MMDVVEGGFSKVSSESTALAPGTPDSHRLGSIATTSSPFQNIIHTPIRFPFLQRLRAGFGGGESAIGTSQWSIYRVIRMIFNNDS